MSAHPDGHSYNPRWGCGAIVVCVLFWYCLVKVLL